MVNGFIHKHAIVKSLKIMNKAQTDYKKVGLRNVNFTLLNTGS